MIGRILCLLGAHGRYGWISPARGGGYWRSHCKRCGCGMTRDPATGRWAAAEFASQQA